MVMTTLNGLLRECDSFIRGICARIKLTNFNKIWEECVHGQGRIVNREEKLNDNEDKYVSTHTKNGIKERKTNQGSSPRRLPTSKGIRNLEAIIHPFNATHVIGWDTLLDIFLLINIISRRRNQITMPMHLKKMNRIRRGP